MTDNTPRWLLMALLMLFVVPAWGQAGEGLPDWLVPVVRVLPEDRVIPASGIYLGRERVLVPSELAADGARLLVLDGGSDLARFGREASIEQRFNLSGLTVLRVTGLQRSVPVLGLLDGSGNEEVTLQAFPPASLMAAGQGSLTIRTTLEHNNGIWTVSPDQPLPNVTGAMVDACGYWVGHSAARGLASMSTSQNTQYRFMGELQPLFEQAGATLQIASCELSWPEPLQAQEPGTDPEPAGEGLPGPAVEPVTDPVSEPERLPEPPPEPEPEPEPLPEPEPEPEQNSGLDSVAEPAAPAAASSAWRWWLAALLSMLALVLIVVVRRRKAPLMEPAAGSAQMPVTPSDIRSFARLQGQGVDHVLVVVNGQVDLLLGRFDADVLLRSTSASRKHARLHGAPDALLLEDLGSSNGTWCNNQRCKPFEPVAVQPGDELVFADEAYRLAPLAESEPT